MATRRPSLRKRLESACAAVRQFAHVQHERYAAWRARRKGVQPPSEPAPEPEQLPPRGVDLVLVAATLALVGLGLVMVFSASAVHAGARYRDAAYFLRRDVLYVVAGLVALYVGYRVDYRLYRRLTYPLLALCLLALVGLLIPGLGTRVDGAIRWYRLAGTSFQPSEFGKLALVIYLAHSLTKKRTTMRTFSIGFLPHLCVAGVMAALVLRQPDLGTAAILLVVTLLLLFVAGTKLSYIVISTLAALPLVYQLVVGTPWRLRRVLAFLDPWAFRQDAGYQISESLISVGSGGLAGLGLGDGKQKLFFLPAAHTDFVFAIIAEELGLIGVLAVIGLFCTLIARGLRAGLGANDLFGSYLAYGITSTFALQALLHMAVVLGMVPTKGIPLPLVSYGGTALVSALFSVGVLLNIASRNAVRVRGTAAATSDAEGANRKRAQRVVVANARGGSEPESRREPRCADV